MKTQNFPGMDFCQKQVSGIHFYLRDIEINPPPPPPEIDLLW